MPQQSTKELLLISGSTRDGSVNSAVLTTASKLLPVTWSSATYHDLAELPHFNPDVEMAGPPVLVLELRRQVSQADAVLFSTPEYAGAMPGALKNLLEWTIGDTVMAGKVVGWINPSTSPQRAAGTYATLETVLQYTGAFIAHSASKNIPVARSNLNSDGIIDDAGIQKMIGAVVQSLIDITTSHKANSH